jgi:hypothetical protein
MAPLQLRNCRYLVGITEEADYTWLVSFVDYDPGFIDKEVSRAEPVGVNLFAPKMLPLSPEWTSGKWYAWQDLNLRPTV